VRHVYNIIECVLCGYIRICSVCVRHEMLINPCVHVKMSMYTLYARVECVLYARMCSVCFIRICSICMRINSCVHMKTSMYTLYNRIECVLYEYTRVFT